MTPLAGTFDAMRRIGLFDPAFNAARLAGVTWWGPGVASMLSAAAARFPNRTVVSDDRGDISYATYDCQATNLAAHLRARVVGGSVGILSRNHRGFLLAQIASERAGVDVVLLSTALPASRLAAIVEHEGIGFLIADAEFGQVAADAGVVVDLVADTLGEHSLQDVAARPGICPPPSRRSRLVMLTSGTTGAPRGARRSNSAPGLAGLDLMARIPYQVGDRILVGPPLFHAWGLSQATIALATASTLVIRGGFDADRFLEILRHDRIDVLAVVPLMLQRLLRAETSDPIPHPPRVVVSSGNVLSGRVAAEWMDRFGDRLYNLYGSTEAAVATVATPTDLRSSPGTVGRPPHGVTLSILDPSGMPVGSGERGRVFVSNAMQFGGYTDGTDQERAGTLMATGDLGHLDENDMLHISGRANDMIVTGGENVFPSAVEEVLEQLPEIEVAAVVGIADEEFGQRVMAFVVPQVDSVLEVDAVREAVARCLPKYMVPRDIQVVRALPMTTTGKVIRHQLVVLGQSDRY